jgi:hypothetical protein
MAISLSWIDNILVDNGQLSLHVRDVPEARGGTYVFELPGAASAEAAAVIEERQTIMRGPRRSRCGLLFVCMFVCMYVGMQTGGVGLPLNSYRVDFNRSVRSKQRASIGAPVPAGGVSSDAEPVFVDFSVLAGGYRANLIAQPASSQADSIAAVNKDAAAAPPPVEPIFVDFREIARRCSEGNPSLATAAPAASAEAPAAAPEQKGGRLKSIFGRKSKPPSACGSSVASGTLPVVEDTEPLTAAAFGGSVSRQTANCGSATSTAPVAGSKRRRWSFVGVLRRSSAANDPVPTSPVASPGPGALPAGKAANVPLRPESNA